MKLRFSKMQGAGNDFVVLDATREPLSLTPAQYRYLADRRFGVGADQILIVERSDEPDVDFRYRIVNADGSEVEQCGNGARCFVRFVHDSGLTGKRTIRVRTLSGLIEPSLQSDGRVSVDMGAPVFEPVRVPFDARSLQPRRQGDFDLWPLEVAGQQVEAAVLSMGNPHAVMPIGQFGKADVDAAPVESLGPLIERHVRFPKRVNAGFLQVVSRGEVRLRVYERGVGETLACGTGSCAAAVAGMRLGWLDPRVDVHTRGGVLTIEWAGGTSPVLMTGPATHVFDGEVELPQ
ncbi:MAG TPA: diaminopimelate epimerase [Burkholderiaceae bacterium]|jgi:diaminopimelate epimerase|nr:diaminopimelate epimerase [Burkholderiaceae bacterium]